MVDLSMYENEYFLTHKASVDTTLKNMTWNEIQRIAYQIAREIKEKGYEKAIITSEDYLISSLERELAYQGILVYYPIVKYIGNEVKLVGLIKSARRYRR